MQGGDRWGISAPESYILLHGPRGGLEPEGEAFRLALVELTARGWIFHEASGESPESPNALLLRGDTDFAPKDRPLVAALAVFEGALSEAGDPDEGIPAEYVFDAARERYGELSGYVGEDVLPSLEERGYYQYANDKILGFIPRKRWRETGTGEKVREDLARITEKARELPELARRDPAGARSFLDGAGPVLLLMPFLYPDITGLSGAGLPGGGEGALDPSSFEGLSGISEDLDSAIPAALDDWLGSPGSGDGGGGFGGDAGGGGGI